MSAPAARTSSRPAWTDPVAEDSVRITYVDHSVYVIQTEGGLSVATDYNGYLGPVDFVPDVATMNHAHSSHWTSNPDSRIPHVLRGWGDGEGPADHHLDPRGRNTGNGRGGVRCHPRRRRGRA